VQQAALRLFKAEMGTSLACDDFYENASPAANFHGLKTEGSRTKRQSHGTTIMSQLQDEQR